MSNNGEIENETSNENKSTLEKILQIQKLLKENISKKHLSKYLYFDINFLFSIGI